jgi:hypothetical protein
MFVIKDFLAQLANLQYIGGNSENLKIIINNQPWFNNRIIEISKSAGVYVLSNPVNPELKKIGFASMNNILTRLSSYGTYFPLGVNIEALIIFDFKTDTTNLKFFQKVIDGDKEYEEYFPENFKKCYDSLKNKYEDSDYLDKVFELGGNNALYLTTLARTLEYNLHIHFQKYKLTIQSNNYARKNEIPSSNKKIKAFGEFFKITTQEFLDELRKIKFHQEFDFADVIIFPKSFFFGEYLNKPKNLTYTVYSNILRYIKYPKKDFIKEINITL